MTAAKHWLRRGVILAIVVAVTATAWLRLTRQEPLAVALTSIDRGTVEASVANTRSGTINACRRAKIAPTVGGQIARLLVREGDAVNANQLMLELWNDDLAAEVELAQREARASEATASEVCVRAESADRDAKRAVELQKKNLIAEEAVDRAVTSAQAQQAACRAAQVRATVAAARVSVVQAALRRTQLHAPFAGRVAELNAEIGEYVTPSPPGIATLPAVDLVDTQCLYVSAPLDEVDAPKVRAGMPARITLDAFPGRTFQGRLRRVADYVLEREKQARTVEIEAVFADPAEAAQLLPGYSADVEVILELRADVLRVPSEAVLEGNKVLLYDDASGRLSAVSIETGAANWKYTEVLGGLQQGQRVLLSVDRKGAVDGALVSAEAPRNSARAAP